jgi:chromosomal replication initiation ATPase DnaA
MIPTELTTVEDLARHYAAVRKRMMEAANNAPKPKQLEYAAPARTLSEAEKRFHALPGTKTVKMMIREVAVAHKLEPHELLLKSRRAHIVRARQELMYIMWSTLRWSLPRIGKALGGFDHTTVLHACRAHKARMEREARQQIAAE